MKTQKPSRRTPFSRRLTTRLLINISLWSTLVVLVITGVNFWDTYRTAKNEQIRHLVTANQQRIEREAGLFDVVSDTSALLAEAFLESYQRQRSDTALIERFDSWFEETEPGVLRLSAEFVDGVIAGNDRWQNLSAFVGPRETPVSDELKVRIMVGLEVLARYGPAWQNLVSNTHISMPENVLLIYSTNSPWGLMAAPDLVITNFSVVRSTLQSHNPERRPNWTGLYYDLSVAEWVISHQRPVDLDGQHLISASHDIHLTEVMQRMVNSREEDAAYVLFNQQRELIAAADELSDRLQTAGIMKLSDIASPLYSEVYEIIESQPPDIDSPVRVYDGNGSENILIATYIEGPEWWHVTILPRQNIQLQALQMPVRVAFLGLSLLFMVLLIVYAFVNHNVSRPLRQLSKAADLVGQQRFEEVGSWHDAVTYNKGEIGLLSRSFKDMAKRITEHHTMLEKAVSTRTADLASANRKLDAMAHLDGLTGLLNRRAFDRDLNESLSANAESTALLLADVDNFKSFNDNYGHQAGDEALKRIASTLKDSPARVYRYGGEEIALLLPAESLREALKVSDSLRSEVEALNISHEYCVLGVITLSIGVTMLATGETAEHALHRADKALYLAKAEGRNTVKGQS